MSTKKKLVVYDNTKIEGPEEEVNWIVSLIHRAIMQQVRRSAQIPPLEGSQLEDFTKDWG